MILQIEDVYRTSAYAVSAAITNLDVAIESSSKEDVNTLLDILQKRAESYTSLNLSSKQIIEEHRKILCDLHKQATTISVQRKSTLTEEQNNKLFAICGLLYHKLFMLNLVQQLSFSE
jgi:hypothetical protein